MSPYNQPSSNSHQTGMISCKGLEAMVSGPERTTKQSVGPDGASFLEDNEKKVCLNMKIERKPVTSDCADPPSPTRVTELPSELPLGRYFSSEEELERVLEEFCLSATVACNLTSKELRLCPDPSIIEPRGSCAKSSMSGPRELGGSGEKAIQTISNWFKPRTALHESANLTLLFGATRSVP